VSAPIVIGAGTFLGFKGLAMHFPVMQDDRLWQADHRRKYF
jgi:hypothetical protein